MSGIAFHHSYKKTVTIRPNKAWPSIIAIGQKTQSDDVTCDMPLWPLARTHNRMKSSKHAHVAIGQHTRSDDIEHGMPLCPLDSRHGGTMSGIEFHHNPWASHTNAKWSACHDIITLGQYIRSIVIKRCIPSLPIKKTQYRSTSGVSCYHRPWTAHTI